MTARLVVAVFAGVLFSTPAWAQDPAGPLGTGPTVPRADEVSPVDAPAAPAWHFHGASLGVGVAATAFSVPLTVALAAQLGTLSAGLVTAAVPALLTLLIVPPLVVTSAMWLFANLSRDGGFRLTPALWAALGTHFAAVVVAGIIGAAANQATDMVLLTAAEAVLMPAATWAVLHGTRRPPQPGVATLRWEF